MTLCFVTSGPYKYSAAELAAALAWDAIGLDIASLNPDFTFPAADLYLIPAPIFLQLHPQQIPMPSFVYGGSGTLAACFAASCSDYLREPWEIPELLARLGRFSETKFTVGSAPAEQSIHFSLTQRTLQNTSTLKRVELSQREALIMRLLIAGAGQAVSHQIFFRALGIKNPESRVIDVHISSLRKKIALLLGDSRIEVIKTCHQQGYMLVFRY